MLPTREHTPRDDHSSRGYVFAPLVAHRIEVAEREPNATERREARCAELQRL